MTTYFQNYHFQKIYEWSEYDDNKSIIEEVNEPVTETPRTPMTIRTKAIKRQATQSGQGLKINTKQNDR